MAELTPILQEILTKITPPKVTLIEKDGAWLNSALTKLPNYGTAIKRFALDNKFWTCSGADFAKAIIWDWSNQKPWVEESRDCDEFAFQFKANLAWFFGMTSVAFVVDYSSRHAYNIVILDDGIPRVLEPQSDRWGLQGKDNYKLEDAIILI